MSLETRKRRLERKHLTPGMKVVSEKDTNENYPFFFFK